MSDSPVSFLIERSLGNAQDGTPQSFPDPGLEPLLFRAVPPLAPGVVILTTARAGLSTKPRTFARRGLQTRNKRNCAAPP